jgi:REP element-mobilizing transposase RayT
MSKAQKNKTCGAGVPPAGIQGTALASETAVPQFHFTDPRETPFVDPTSRGYLPHLYKEGGSYFVTFRLWDAVIPKEQREKAGGTPAPQDKEKRPKTREEIAAESEPPLELGSCVLAKPSIARMVQKSLQHFHGERYYLHAWCVMSNHLHVVYTALGSHTPKDIHHSWNSYTAHQANKLLKRSGTFWEADGFDHLIRSLDDLEWFLAYTENNPVTAGLCENKEQWPWSSAGSGWNPRATYGAGVWPVGTSEEMVAGGTATSQCEKPPAGGTATSQCEERWAGGTPAPQGPR